MARAHDWLHEVLLRHVVRPILTDPDLAHLREAWAEPSSLWRHNVQRIMQGLHDFDAREECLAYALMILSKTHDAFLGLLELPIAAELRAALSSQTVLHLDFGAGPGTAALAINSLRLKAGIETRSASYFGIEVSHEMRKLATELLDEAGVKPTFVASVAELTNELLAPLAESASAIIFTMSYGPQWETAVQRAELLRVLSTISRRGCAPAFFVALSESQIYNDPRPELFALGSTDSINLGASAPDGDFPLEYSMLKYPGEWEDRVAVRPHYWIRKLN